MGRIDVKQGTPEWHELRQTKISATMCSSILGLNPYKSSYQLYEELIGLREIPPPNNAMIRGSALEADALKAFNEQNCVDLKPAVFVSGSHSFAMCSLDGITDDEQYAIEIKCGVKAFNDLKKGIIAPYYIAQMQHQMWVCNLPSIIYCCYDGKKINHEHVGRDDAFIHKMIVKEEDFYRDWQNLKPPTIDIDIWDTTYEEYVAKCDEFVASVKKEIEG